MTSSTISPEHETTSNSLTGVAPLDHAPTLTEEPDKISPEDAGVVGSEESAKESPRHFSRTLSSANFSPNGDLYDSLDDDWSESYGTGELSLFDFLDSFSVVPSTLDKLNQRLKLQSKEVPLPPSHLTRSQNVS